MVLEVGCGFVVFYQAEALGSVPDSCAACLSVVRDLSDVLLRRKGAKGSPKFLSPAHVSDTLDDLCQDIPMRCVALHIP